MATETIEAGPFTDLEVMTALAAPIDPSEVESRIGDNGKKYRYVNAATCRRRLDQVVGPANWETKQGFFPGAADHAAGFVCALTVHLPSGKSVVRTGVGGVPEMLTNKKDDQGRKLIDRENSTKGGASDAFKRACVEFGIGSDLYEDAAPDPGPARPGPAHGNGVGNGKPRDVWGPGRPEQAPPGARPERPGDDRAPTTGARFHGWLKDRERESGEAGLFRHVERWGREQGRPGMFRDWSAAEVREGVAEARRFLGEA